jgi:hypothetical protein
VTFATSPSTDPKNIPSMTGKVTLVPSVSVS